mmetsp:Transcript_948/g.2068  ORF Transcript_948/g.2068 Transcript_948/m.2068 type:complete len:663 (+) Transcript_948:88-2076(+)
MKLFAVATVLVSGTQLRPVAKVKKLLSDMREQLDSEQKEDDASKEKMDCWCNSNGDAKEQAIAIAGKQMDSLTATIGDRTAFSAKMKADIAALDEDVESNKAALERATAIRDEEAAKFHAEERDLLQSIDALKNAVVVLGKHNSGASMMSVQAVLRTALAGHSDIMRDIDSRNGRAITSLLQIQQPAHFDSYAPQSGQIFGILNEMKEQFEKNLAAARTSELAAKENYAQLKSSKEEEISAAQDSISEKESDLADSNEDLANAKSDLEDTTEAQSADTAFLGELRAKCSASEEEYQERKKTRADESGAVAEALSILDSPETFKLFGETTTQKSLETQRQGFLQLGSARSHERRIRDQGIRLLSRIAERTKSPSLIALSASARLDTFEKVIAAIDKMIVELKQQNADEIAKRDWCTDELNFNEKALSRGAQSKSYLETKLEQLGATIKTLSREVDAATAEIAASKVQLQRAGEDRNGENNEFQATVADQRATQAVLTKVVQRLRQYYEKTELMQQPDTTPGAQSEAPPPAYKTFKQNSGGNKVVAMIEDIVAESQRLENEAVQAEKDAQAAYEDFVQRTNNEVAALQSLIAEKSDQRAAAKEDEQQAEADHKSNEAELDRLTQYKADVHGQCDFVLENFEIRQESRTNEINSLQEAKAIFSGA